MLERNSYPDTLPRRQAGAPLLDRSAASTRRSGSSSGPARQPSSGGSRRPNWDGAPALADKSFRHDLGGREFDLYYSGSHLHMVVLRTRTARRYWVVNTLLDSLSNETMLAIAKGLKPLTTVK